MAKSAKRWRRVSISVLVTFLLASGGYWLWWQLGSRAIHQQTYRHTGIVTVFVPGYGSNSLTFGPMVQRFKQDKASDQVTTIHVSADGKRTITGADRYNGKIRSSTLFLPMLSHHKRKSGNSPTCCTGFASSVM